MKVKKAFARIFKHFPINIKGQTAWFHWIELSFDENCFKNLIRLGGFSEDID